MSLRPPLALLADDLEGHPLDLGPHSSPDGAVTLLVCDVEGARDLAERLAPRWSQVLEDHACLVRREVEAHAGAVIKAQGDVFTVALQSAHAGLRCAVSLQRAVARVPVPELGEALRVRVGVHSGFVIASANDFLGRNVVLAARIADRARGGEVLVSSTLKQYTETDPSFTFEPRGEFHFKGVLGEHRLYAAALAAGS